MTPQTSTPSVSVRRASAVWRAGRALMLALLLSSPAAAHAEPGWVMVPGAGVGRVTLGMKGADLIALLGAPKAYCSLGAYGADQQLVTVLYYADRGLAMTLSASRSEVARVSRIHVVAGYSATLSDETSAGGRGGGYRKCAPHGTLTLDVAPGSYVTSNGIRPGSSRRDVVRKFGPPKAEYPAVAPGSPASPVDVDSLLVHQELLLPYPARIFAYDGIVFGIYHDAVVAITVDWTGFDPHRYVVADLTP